MARMCGAYEVSVKDPGELYDRFDVVNRLDDFTPHFKVIPGQWNPVITSHRPNQISRMYWSLVPPYAETFKQPKFSTFNAKKETVATLPTYKGPLRKHRCLIPANGFFEPDKIHYTKAPFPWYYFRFKDQRIFAIAGIYEIWTDKKTGEQKYSYSLIPTEPNDVVGKVHPRMPVILRNKEDEETWLNPDITEPEHLLPLLQPYTPADEMEGWRVGSMSSPV